MTSLSAQRESPVNAESREDVGAPCSSPPTATPPPTSRHSSPPAGLHYPMCSVKPESQVVPQTLAHAHTLEKSISRSLPTLLGTFHSLTPGVTPSAFRPLFPRPLHHHPLALQHHTLARPHPAWLP